jgi:hypothetical protein
MADNTGFVDQVALSRTLTEGLQGGDVRILQRALLALGYEIVLSERRVESFGNTTLQAVQAFQGTAGLRGTGAVDQRTAEAINTKLAQLPAIGKWMVGGTLRDPDGSPLANMLIRAIDKGLRTEAVLGEATTGTSGVYVIEYRPSSVAQTEKDQRADLVVRAFRRRPGAATDVTRPPASEELLAESAVWFNAPPLATVDLMVGGGVWAGPSEYERLASELTPLLSGLSPAAITSSDVSFLSGETEYEPVWIEYYSLAVKLAEQTRVAPEAFYGLFRERMPRELRQLVARRPAALRHALELALRDKIIPRRISASIPEILRELVAVAVDQVFVTPPGGASIADVLSTVLPGTDNTALQRTFLEQYMAHQGPVADFWKALRGQAVFAPLVPKLQLALQFGSLTRNHVPLIRALLTKYSRLSDLAQLTESGWLDLINGVSGTPGSGYPRDVPGPVADKPATYARILNGMIEEALPTQVIANRLNDLNIENKPALASFFAGSGASFDIRTDVVDDFLRRTTVGSGGGGPVDTVGGGGPLAVDLAGTLGRLQRLYKVAAPHIADLKAVLSIGAIGSAHDISRMGTEGLAEATGLSIDRAGAIFENAQQAVAGAQLLFGKYAKALNPFHLFGTDSGAVEDLKLPNYQELFSLPELCQCPECRSVYSPAAYLVDLLALVDHLSPKYRPYLYWIDGKVNGVSRRSDLGQIELTCVNTNTPLPYIDLVNEVLEHAVVRSTPNRTELQTTRAAEELGVSPEHILPAAYSPAHLGGALYPWDLPFDLAAEAARTFLSHFGVRRFEVMEAFQSLPPALQPASHDVAAEYLGLTAREVSILESVAPAPWAYWGLQQNNNNVLDPTDPQKKKTLVLAWLGVLGLARYFAERAQLSAEQMVELSKTRLFAALGLGFTWPAGECALDHATIDNLTKDTQATELVRFLRLQRKLGWSISDLDRFRSVIGGMDIESIATFERLRTDLNLPFLELLSWFGPIDTAVGSDGSPSFYAGLFLNTAIRNPADAIFLLNANGTDLQVATDTISQHVAAVASGLGVPASEFDFLFRSGVDVADILNLDGLTKLHRAASIARALGLSIRDFATLRNLAGIDPLLGAALPDMKRLITIAGKVRRAHFSVPELDFLLRHMVQPTSGIAPTLEEITQALSDLRDGLQKVARDNGFPGLVVSLKNAPADPKGELTRKKLGSIVPSDKADDAFALVAGSSPLSADLLHDFVNAYFKDFLPDLKDAVVQLVAANYGAVPPLKPPQLTSAVERFNYVLPALLVYLDQTQSSGLVKKRLAEDFGVDIRTAEIMVQMQQTPKNTYLDLFLSPAFVASTGTIDPVQMAAQFDGYRLLQKSALIIGKLRIGADELAAIRAVDANGKTRAARVGWLQFEELPLTPQPGAAALLGAWERMADLFGLRDSLPRVKPSLFDIFAKVDAMTPLPLLVGDIAKLTGWSASDLVDVIAAQGLNLQFPADYQDERGLIHVKMCLDLLARLGMPPSKVAPWRAPHLTLGEAFDLRNAVKARYSFKEWLKVAKPLQDILRAKQRAALVSYLRARDGLDDNGLFDRYLIDVDMSPCQLTSRIKQAIGSVQLFIQRISMSLERDQQGKPLVLKEPAATWWLTWMRGYGLWEANRKVFLYPENWIEPELRDDKTIFFTDLEKELKQNEVTADQAETAFLHYLEKLDAAAALDIRAVYWEYEFDFKAQQRIRDSLHVVARTYGEPHTYYYRRGLDQISSWTSWEKIDVDIVGNHLVWAVLDRRLRLYWPIFKTIQDSSKNGVQKDTGSQPVTLLEIHLAWSEYKNGKWTPKKVHKDPIVLRGFTQDQIYFSSTDGASMAGFWQNMPGEFVGDDDDLVIAAFGVWDPNGWPEWAGWWVVPSSGGALAKDFYVENIGVFNPFANLPVNQGFQITGQQIVEDEPNNNDQLWLNSTVPGVPVETLGSTPGTFHVTFSPQSLISFSDNALFYNDERRDYLIVRQLGPGYTQFWPDPENADPGQILDGPNGLPYDPPDQYQPSSNDSFLWRFYPHYHPYVGSFIKELNQKGVEGLLTRENQQLVDAPTPFSVFDVKYQPQDAVAHPYPRELVEFAAGGSYAPYNWELFFHGPLLVANSLSRNQRFEDARRWYHFVFNPTALEPKTLAPDVWRFAPFKTIQDHPIDELLALLDYSGKNQQYIEARKALEQQVRDWRSNPFNPHMIARHRLTAYEKTVVMKYLDNLIAWGDQLFRQDTIETINQATQLYILAAELLGDKPQILPSRGEVAPQTYDDLVKPPGLDAFSNKLVKLENWVPLQQQGKQKVEPVIPAGMVFYFCIPPNDKLLGYWDTVADRLYKIRHCLNIEGVFQQLPLFEPPLDVGLLVNARSAGVDVATALQDINSALPHYRFSAMLPKALEFCADVKAFGAQLLATLEKQDAEGLALLRSGQEIAVLKAARDIKQRQIDESQAALDGLLKNQEMVQSRLDYYASRPFTNQYEQAHLALTAVAETFQEMATQHEVAASLAKWVPNFQIGIEGWTSSPTITANFGGEQIGGSLQAIASALRGTAGHLNTSAAMSATMGGYQRRADEWAFQKDLAATELAQIGKQILAAQIRLEVAQRELDNHDLQIANAQAVDDFMHRKFTNADLYDWMATQAGAIYFQSYQLAYDIAKRAEKTFQFETGDTQASFVQFGYWDSLKKGLLTGERLHYDLRRMDAGYLDRNQREFEITKHVSLAQVAPLQFLTLKSTGTCTVHLDESLFDRDFPGHYLRRIKSVAITIPCVTGPYTGVHAQLTLLANKVRWSSDAGLKYLEDGVDSRFRYDYAAKQPIVTSTAQNDTGLFEVNLRDERYLPFEGAGVISTWQIDLNQSQNTFDVNTATDVILHVRYTSRDGGPKLAGAVPAPSVTGVRLLSARQDFPDKWQQFFYPASGAEQKLVLTLTTSLFPFTARGLKKWNISMVHVLLKLKDAPLQFGDAAPSAAYNASAVQLSLVNAPLTNGKTFSGAKPLVNQNGAFGIVPTAQFTVADINLQGVQYALGTWQLSLEGKDNAAGDIGALPAQLLVRDAQGNVLGPPYRLSKDAVDDIWVLVTYTAS